MKRKVYLETSVISYLTARPSRTIIGAAHQQITQAVWQECALGNAEAASRRLAVLEGLDVLAVTEEMISLAEELIAKRLIPAKALEDSLHIAVATLHHVDFLLTWNCRHIANPVIQEGIAEYLEQQGLFLPIICTPEELLGGRDDE